MNRTFFRSYPRLLEDSYVLFLRWVISSTRRGYLKWDVKPGVIVTKARSMRLEFKTEETIRGRLSWNLFIVAEARAELFRATPRNRTSPNLPRPVVTLVNSLFRLVSKSLSRPIVRERKTKANENRPRPNGRVGKRTARN
jgi:hypothetical protein